MSDESTNLEKINDSRLAGLRFGIGGDTNSGSVMPPIYSSVNYLFDKPEIHPEYDYSRTNNPTRDVLNKALAQLEGGTTSTQVGSGLGAYTLLILALTKAGDLIVAPKDCYGGTWRLLDHLATRGDLRNEFIDTANIDEVREACQKNPRMVFVETPSNPLLGITDIEEVTKIAHEAGALVVVDNTFCSPLLQHPIELGADIVMHSTTKFINGHSDAVGGAVIAADEEIGAQLKHWANVAGLTAGPFDSWLTLRGLRTLYARLRANQENAKALVELLVSHPAVEKVYYPGLESHPGHDIAKKQMEGPGSLLSFDLAGGLPAAERLVDGLKVFNLAQSLGGIESLISISALMTHNGMTPEARAAAGLKDGLLRISAGIEPTQDLLADLRAGLDRASEID